MNIDKPWRFAVALAVAMLMHALPAKAAVTAFLSAGNGCGGGTAAGFSTGGPNVQLSLCVTTTAPDALCGVSYRLQAASGEGGAFNLAARAASPAYNFLYSAATFSPFAIANPAAGIDLGAGTPSNTPNPVGANQLIATLDLSPQTGTTNASYVLSLDPLSVASVDDGSGDCSNPSEQSLSAGFTLNRAVPPIITSAGAATFTVNSAGAFTVTASGTPSPTLSISGALPTGINFTSGSGELSGTPALGSVGTYPLIFTATNGNAPNATQNFTLTIQKANQAISFGALANRAFSATPFTISATANSGLGVSFSSATPAQCSVSGSSVTMLAAGTCTIAADQAGNANYNAAAQVAQSFTIGATTQTIAFGAAPTPTYSNGGTFTVSATASSGLAVTFSSLTTGTCTASSATVTMIAAGTCIIAANQAGNANYDAAPQVTQNISIAVANQTIAFGTLAGKTLADPPFTISATASSGLAVTFASLTSGTCTVAGNTVTIVAVGTCTIVADQAGNANYNAAPQITRAFAITKAGQTIAFGAAPSPTYASGGTFTVSASATSGLAVAYSSLTTGVCSTSGATVTMLSAGTCTIAANQAGDATYDPATQATQNVSIGKAAQTITFGTAPTPTYANGGTFTVSASATSGLAVAYSSLTTGICATSGATVTMLSAGTCTIAANQAGDTNYLAAPQATQNVVIGQAAQTISFGAQAAQTFAPGGTFSLSPLASASSGLAIGYSSTTPGTCTISGTTVTMIAAGACTIAANQAGNANYSAAAQVTQGIAIGKANQTIAFGALANKTLADAPFMVSATASSGLTVAFASSTASVCTISGGTLTIVATGTCTVTADQAGNANYNAAPQAAQSFTVTKADQTISFGPQAAQTYAPGGTFAISPVATASSGLTVSYGSTTTGVCTVSGTTVTIVSAGTCTLAADQTGNTVYNPAVQATQNVNIGKAAQTIAFGALANKTLADPPFTVSATASSGLAVSFASATTGVCTISGNTVTIAGAGTCTIAADQAGNGNYLPAAQVTQSFVVGKANQSIAFAAQAGQAYAPGSTFAINPLATASSGLGIVYSSTTASVCTVSGATITIVTAGTCTIAADQPGNATYNAAPQVTQDIAIGKANQTIAFGALANKTLADAPFAVSATASSGLAVAFSSTTAAVCTVSGSAVTVLATGTCTIAADQAGNANYHPAPQITQSFSVSKASQTITFAAQAAQTYSAGSSFAISPQATASSGLAVIYSSTTAAVCTVGGTTVTIVAAGVCTIAADQPGNATYNAAPQVVQNVAIGKANQSISFGALANKTLIDPPFAVTATASSGLTVAFASTTTGVCTVSGNTVTIVATGTCTMTADQAGNANYNAAPQVAQSFSVSKASQTITFGAQSGQSYSAGGTFAINPLASASSGLPVAYGSTTAGVCTVSGSTVTIVGAGSCVLTADQVGNTTYLAAPQVTQNVAIGKANQTIAFGTAPTPVYSAGGTFTVSASASSGLTVSFSSLTTGICTSSGATVTIIAAGTCIVAANQAGNANYNAAPQATQNVVIGKAGQTITFSALADKTLADAPFMVSATASSGLAVSFSTTTPSICTVSGTTVTLAATGTCTIAANQAGSANYDAAPQVIQSFGVIKASQSITFGPQAAQTYSAGGTFTVNPLATASSGLAVTYSSTTIAVCTISGTTVTVVAAGNCAIAADQAGNATYNAATQVIQTIVIGKANQTIAFGALAGKTLADPPFAVAATASSGLAVTFGSITPGVCTVSGITVTIVATGTCTIAADQAGNANHNAAAQATQSFTVTKAAQTITFAALPDKNLGDAPFTVAASASSGLGVAFSSLTPSTCTASGSTITLVAVGTCTIAANQAGNATYNAAPQVSRSFSVLDATPPDTTITSSPPALSNSNSATFNFSATEAGTFECALDAAPFAVCTSPKNYAGLADGPHTFAVRAIDVANNIDPTPATFAWTIDTTSPTVAFTGKPPITAANQASYAVSGSCSEAGRTINVQIAALATSAVCGVPTAGQFTSMAVDASALAQGAVVLMASLTDAAGNVANVTDGTTKDTLGPALTLGTLVGINNANKTSYAFAGTCETAGSAVNYTLNGGPSVSGSAPCMGGTYSANGLNVSSLADGIVTFTVVQTDAFGNPSTTPGSVNKDTQNPIVTIAPPAIINSANQGAYSVSGSCSENGRPVDLALGGSVLASVVCGTPTAGAYLAANIAVNGLADGSVAITATHSDTSGNGANANAAASKDTIAPTAPAVTAPNGTILVDQPMVTGTAEPASMVTVYIDGVIAGTPTTTGGGAFSFPLPQPLSPLAHSVRATATDAAGNVSASSASIAFYVAPSITVAPVSLPGGTVGAAYGQTINAMGGMAPYSFAVTAGTIADGINLAITGNLAGTPTTAGIFNFTVTATDADTHGPFSGSRAYSMSIAPGSQFITFGTLATRSFGDPPFTLSASSSAGLAPSFTSQTPAVCTVVGTTVSLVAAGPCTITASQNGNANYNAAAPVSQSFNVTKAGQTLTFGAQPAQVFSAGGTFTLNPAATASSGLAVTYGTTTSGICTIAGATVTMVATGSCIITADQAGNANYNAAPQTTQTIAIGSALPGAPTIVSATPGDGQAVVSFTPPASNGGSAITGYTATCNPGAIAGSGTASPITVGGLANGSTYACSVTATNGAGTGPASANLNVTPLTTITLTAAFSRKTHGAAGTFSLPLDLGAAIAGAVSVEPRDIGVGHRIVFVFSGTVTAVGAAASTAGTVAGMSFSGNEVTVTLTGIADAQRATVSVSGVNGTASGAVSVGFLKGDVNGSRAVTASDIAGAKARLGQTTNASNYPIDINTSGSVDASDLAAIRTRSGTLLP